MKISATNCVEILISRRSVRIAQITTGLVYTVSGSRGTEDGAYAKITYDFPGVDCLPAPPLETLIFEAFYISEEIEL